MRGKMRLAVRVSFNVLWVFVALSEAYLTIPPPFLSIQNVHLSLSPLHSSSSDNDLEKRKADIQRKITELKKTGRLPQQRGNDSVDDGDVQELTGAERLRSELEKTKRRPSVVDQYSVQLQVKLGRKAKYLGVDIGNKGSAQRRGQIGSLTRSPEGGGELGNTEYQVMTPDLIDEDDDEEEEEVSIDEEEMVILVAEKLKQRREIERQEEEERRRKKLEELRLERERAANASATTPRTSGVGGAYNQNETALQDTRRPSRGSWGYFERPTDISKAYGGGRRVGAGYMKEEDKEASYERTRQRMKEYRQRMGLEVESEVEHAGEIDNALKIAKVAMAKGIYNTAVSALEKVTAWCSSNSKVGSKVFLELAMAYEAVGRADEAMQVYRNLANCRIGEVRENAKRLLYGLESFEFMKSDAQLASFNRKKIRNTFIETTGIDRFAMNFDDVYNTAYVDTSSREYKKLTENVVRSVREARQILLKATDSGIVERTKIVQALRSLARRFDEALREEKKAAELARQPVPMMDGRPIVSSANRQDNSAVDFHLADPEQMIENLNGEWRLQLIADRTGDGVKYYNTTLSWQQVDTNGMQFSSQGQVGFLTISEAGYLEFEGENRILRRSDISTTGGGSVLAGLLRNQGGASSSGVAQQVITVDSILLVTRCAEMARWQDEERDHFAVWRRVEPGTYSKR